MSEVDSRPVASRGRSSTRARGAFSRAGARAGPRPTNGTSSVQIDEPLDDQGELGDMKKTYSTQLSFMRDMFPDWTDVDLVFALAEADGDVQVTIDRITQGNVSQFAEVPKKGKDRSRSKAKDVPAAAAGGPDQATTPVRGGRARGGFESSRGGRGRGIDRARGGFRGARGGHAAAESLPKEPSSVSVPTTESPAWNTVGAPAEPAQQTAWDQAPPAEPAKDQGTWGNVIASESTPATASEGAKSTLIPEGGAKKTWASMFAKPIPPPVPVVPKQPALAPAPAAVPGPVPAELAKSEEPASAPAPAAAQETEPEEPQEPEPVPSAPAATEEKAAAEAQEPAPAAPEQSPPVQPPVATPEVSLTPSHDPLTEDNLEHLPDSSQKPATLTAASTVGSIDPRVATPATSQQAPIGRPPMGGYAASAYRAAGTPVRSSSYQRRVLEQQEAVVMPGHNAVDRAAVQFGSMGLNGEPDSPDVDEEREEPETRTQPPQQSPPSQPRASLPPAPRQEPQVQENTPTPRQAPGLPPLPQHQSSFQHDISPIASHPQESSQAQAYAQYGRYGQQPDLGAQPQKSFDPFSHQAPSTAYDQYGSQPSSQQHQQQHQQQQQQQHQPFGAFSSAPSDYSHYYTADQQRNAYQSYYGGSYGQQTVQSQDNTPAQRSVSGFGSAPSESAFSSAQGPQQSRYDAPGSGHNTPAPSIATQPQTAAPAAAMHQQPHSQYGGYPYGHPYYSSPYHAAYQNQFGGYSYGAPFGGKGAMYGQPYGMNPPSSFDHSSSPANAGGFGAQSTMQSRDTGLGSGLGDYGRTSAQPSNLSSGFGGMSAEPFGRSHSGFQGQTQGYGQQQGIQQTGPADELKPFGDSKASGASPALGQPGRPSSAANGASGQAPSSALPPPQSHQAGFGGYPGFNTQYGLGGLGGQSHQQPQQQQQAQQQQQQQQQQQHQQGGYGGYNGGFGNSYYGRGGWGGNYGGH